MMDERRESSLDEIFGSYLGGGEGASGVRRVPYKFLDPYEAEDADIFFGREEEKRELFRKYFSSPFLLIYGESGTGKTSLLRCGLLTQVPSSDLLLIHLKNSASALETIDKHLESLLGERRPANGVTLRAPSEGSPGRACPEDIPRSFTPEGVSGDAPAESTAEILPGEPSGGGPQNDGGEGHAGRAADTLVRLRRLYRFKRKPISLVFDQFEEVFIFQPEEARRELIAQVKSWLDSDLDIRVLFVIREEYLARLTEFESILPQLFQNRVWVRRMDPAQAEEAITGPLKVCGVSIEKDLPQKLLAQLQRDARGIELPDLQVLMDRLYRRAAERNPEAPEITMADYEALGRIENILASFLDERIAELKDPDLGKALLKLAVTAEGTKKPIGEKEAVEALSAHSQSVTPRGTSKLSPGAVSESGPSASTLGPNSVIPREASKLHPGGISDVGPAESGPEIPQGQPAGEAFGMTADADLSKRIEALFQAFERARILRRRPDGAFELRHDALARTIHAWMSETEKELLELKQLVENRYAEYAKRGTLLDAQTLELLTPYKAKLTLTAEQREFIEASERALRKRTRRRRIYLVAAVALAFLILGGFTVWNVVERHRATARYLLSQSLLNADSDKGPAYLAAALRMDPREISSDTASACFDSAQEELHLSHQVLEGHSDAVLSVAFSPDGLLLASASADKTIRLWDVKKGAVRVLKGHEDVVNKVAFSPDGALLASASADKTVRLWDTRTGEARILRGHEDDVKNIAFSPDGDFLASVSYDKTVRLWNVKTGDVRVLKGHEKEVWAVAFSPDGLRLASASEDETVRLWNVKTGAACVLRGHEDVVHWVAFSPDGALLASASSDKTIRLWEVKTGEARVLKGHEGWVRAIAFSPDGSLLASASLDNTVRLWDVKTGEAHVLKGHEDWVVAVAFSPGGALLASASSDKTIRLWNIRTGEARVLKGHEDRVTAVAFSPNGALLASASFDNTVRLWDVKTGEAHVLKGHEDWVVAVAFSPGGALLASASYDKTVRLWDVKSGEARVLNGHDGQVAAVAFSPDGALLASASYDKTVRLWDLRTGEARVLKGHDDFVNAVAFSPDGSLLASGSRDKTVRLWDVRTEEARILKGHEGEVFSVAFSPDGLMLASASWDKTIRLWDVRTGEARVLNGHEDKVFAVAFSPDGLLLASASWDKTVRLWNVKTGECRVLSGHEGRVWDVAFSPGGDQLASCSEDKTVRLWDVKTGEARVLQGHEKWVLAVAFSHDGSLLASSSGDKAVRVWDVRKSETRVLKGHEGIVLCVAFSPDGRLLASASFDRTIRLWTPLPRWYFPNQSKPVWVINSLPTPEILHALDAFSNLRYDLKTDTVTPLPFTGIPKDWLEAPYDR